MRIKITDPNSRVTTVDVDFTKEFEQLEVYSTMMMEERLVRFKEVMNEVAAEVLKAIEKVEEKLNGV